ncbi:hypothetical protein SDC9_61702 [bioreactor metagenome]|uniref:Uncharacterized protein n=1 Tax=bioreactor metagenome TaxID=1076179 RepID=A0A644XMP5_9ZZZZ
MELRYAGLRPYSWNITDAGAILLFSLFSGSEATHAPTACRWGLLNAKILDFGVKAGIGGFHPPRKQLTGKACNGVPHHIEVF